MATKKRIAISLSESQIEKLARTSEEMGLSKSGLVALALTELFERREQVKKQQ